MIKVRVDISKAITVPADLRAAMAAQVDGTASGPFSEMFNQWAKVYEVECRRHFVQAGAGGADWAPLAVSTILKRRVKGGGTRRQARGALATKLRGLKEKSAVRATGAVRGERLKKQLANNLKANLHNERVASKRSAIKKKIAALTSAAGTTILRDTGALFNATAIGGPGNLLQRGRASISFGFQSVPHKGRSKSKPSLARIAAWHDAGGGNLPRRRILIDPSAQTIRTFETLGRRAVDKVLAQTRAKNGGR